MCTEGERSWTKAEGAEISAKTISRLIQFRESVTNESRFVPLPPCSFRTHFATPDMCASLAPNCARVIVALLIMRVKLIARNF